MEGRLEVVLQKEKDELSKALGCDGSLDILLINAADVIVKYRKALEQIASILPFSPADGFHCKQTAMKVLGLDDSKRIFVCSANDLK